jgi:GNAT superfamily N-acetyltransferase
VRLKRMYVRKGYEHRGIAQKLLDDLIAFATINGYKKVLLHTYPIMKGANKFHEKNGFVETKGKDPEMIHVVKFLE